ncbi:transglycosylase SLT domain-containing protein [Candidatus Daviesbacteria bacterium]|nr:transglycosylase SLT domain-containing protein [Candidatus Daviesbacteria bacterium]
MAGQDVNFYKYLEAAFRFKLFNPEGQRAGFDTHFNHLNYNLTYKQIFFYARKILPKFYTSEFPDTEEGNLQMAKKVLEQLDKHQDTQLENQFKSVTVSEENTQIITEAQAQSQQTEAISTQTPVGTSEGMMSGPGLPSAPSKSFGPRRVFIANQTPPPAGGMEGGIGQGTAATNKANAKASRLEAETNRLNVQTAAPRRFNWGGFKIPASFTNAAKNFGSESQRFIGTNLGRIGKGLGEIAGGLGRGIAGPALTGTYNLLGKAGSGSLNAFERITRPGGTGGGGIGRGLSKSSNKLAWGLIGIMLFFVLFGSMLGGLAGTTPTGQASPIGSIGSFDISSCKFTRGQENPKEATFKSNKLLSYIQEASQKSNIPPAVLAAFIRVESPSSSNMSDDQISNYSANCVQSSTGALGIMQIQPSGTTSARGDPASCDDCIDAGAKLMGKTVSTMTRQDYCDPRTNIIVGAGWILKKMSKLGYGDSTKWDTAWTNDRKAIEALVNTYYGCLQYGDATKDCAGPYNYADDVSTSIQNCQAQSQTVPPPLADGNYKKWVQDFGININDGFVPDVYKWAYEVLASTSSIAPKFKDRLGSTLIEIKPTCDISKTSGRIIFLRNKIQFCPGATKDGPTADEKLFKQVFIHELGHIINGSSRPGKYGDQIKQAIAAEGYLTAYSQKAATADDEICGAADLNTRADEDFAESISYFVNQGIKEQDYGCGTNLNQNPIYAQDNNHPLYLKHIQLMIDLLR